METVLESFIGGRLVSNEFLKYAETRYEILENKIYRGLPLPKYFIEIGYTIEEWHGSSHWSLDFDIARGIFANPKEFDYLISEDFREELSEQFGVTYEETLELFVPVVLEFQEPIKIFPTYKVTREYELLKCWEKEKEVTIIGYNFKIKGIQKCEDSFGTYYKLDVEPIQRTLRRLNL